MGHRIRPARRDDVAALRHVSERAWYASYGEFVADAAIESFLDEYYDADTFAQYIEDDEAICYVAKTDSGGVVGFTLAHPVGDGGSTYALGRIYVDPEWWNEGVGTHLLSETESTIRDRDGERIKLGVLADNERAVRFYERRGYERIDEGYDDRLEVRNYTYVKDLES